MCCMPHQPRHHWIREMYLDIQLFLGHGPKCSHKAFGILYASFDAAVGVGRANFELLNGRAMACSGLQDALLDICDRRFLVCFDDNPLSGYTYRLEILHDLLDDPLFACTLGFYDVAPNAVTQRLQHDQNCHTGLRFRRLLVLGVLCRDAFLEEAIVQGDPHN